MSVVIEQLEKYQTELQTKVDELSSKKLSLQNEIDLAKNEAARIVSEAEAQAKSKFQEAESSTHALVTQLEQKAAQQVASDQSLLHREASVALLEQEREDVQARLRVIKEKEKELEDSIRKSEESIYLTEAEKAAWEPKNLELTQKTQELQQKLDSLAKDRLELNAKFQDAEFNLAESVKHKAKADSLLEEAKVNFIESEQKQQELSYLQQDLGKRSEELLIREEKLDKVVQAVEEDKRKLQQEALHLSHEESLLAYQKLGLAGGKV